MAKRTQAANEAQYRYVKAHIKRIPLDVQKEFYSEIKAAADQRGGIREWIHQDCDQGEDGKHIMIVSKQRQQQMIQYQKENLKRIPLSVSKDFYKTIKESADARGMSVNGFIKTAIQEYIKF